MTVRHPMKRNFDDSCSTLFEIIDFETKVKEGKKHESSDLKLEDISDSDSVCSGLTQQAKSGKTDNQHCSISMTKEDPYSRVSDTVKKTTQRDSASCPVSAVIASTKPVVIPVHAVGGRHKPDKNVTSRFPDTVKKTTQRGSVSCPISAVVASTKPVVIPVNAVRGRHEPDKNVTSRVPDTVKKTTQCDSVSCLVSAVIASTKPVVIPVNAVRGRHEPDKNVTSRVPELQKKVVKESQSDVRSSKSLDLSIRKPVAVVPRNVNDGKHQPDENVTNRVSDKQNKPSQSDSRLSTKSVGLASTKPAVIPVNMDGGRWEPDKNVTSRVADNGKKTTQFDSAYLSESAGLASTKPVVIPVNVVGGRPEPDKNGTRRVLGFLKKLAKKRNSILSPSSKSVGQINKKSGPALPVNVNCRSHDPVEIPRRTDPSLQKNVVKESQTDPWSSPDYVGQVSEQAGAELPVNVDVRRYDSDEKARR
ncbi:uncharacterized protein LOC119243986 [Talpa occidentalis]|uniref:uncharacterized protein LOC119243986 n=1 Tax=Talpa occidentalis TaxID=50954 RepID=UPI0023F85376|nr:uncharacterized protein LOC119243986 [Talpa occidentalis]